MLKEFEDWYALHKERFLGELQEFLTFRSVSSDPYAREDCLACANWLVSKIKEVGFNQVYLQGTNGLPVLRASYKVSGAKKNLLYYGHYDVYHEGDLAAWNSAPFQPQIITDRIYARGAQDNKGQTFYFLKALECLIATGQLGLNIEIILDGEEETTTSEGLRALLPELEQQIQADVLMICDTDCISIDCPTIVLGLRGIISLSVEYYNAKGDQHSGLGGGEVNAANNLLKALAAISDPMGRVLIKDYQPKSKISDVELNLMQALLDRTHKLSPNSHLIQLKEKMLARCFASSIDVSSIKVGTFDSAVRTIIPGRACAQITSRLIPEQDPEVCMSLLENHFMEHCHADLQFKVLNKTIGAAGVRISAESEYLTLASEVLKEVTAAETVYDWEGSSIPFVSWVIPSLAKEAVIVGFGLEQDAVHAPNESFSLEQFRKGFLYSCRYLSKLKNPHP